MKKTKILIIAVLLAAIFIFSIAALCNQCGIIAPATTTATETTAAGQTTTTAQGATTSESTGQTMVETTEQCETTEVTTAATSEQKTKPAIKLEIYEGPTYSPGDDVCWYRIKATVTGNPKPTIVFSKDDSGGACGKYQVQISIRRFQPYTLTATVKNSEGTATDSINLTWGCGSENRNPDVSDISTPDPLYVSSQYDVSVNASDPDGDSLTYAWTVSGGSINNAATNPIKWTAPAAAGSYSIQVKITDGKGGETTKSKTVTVQQSSINLTLHQVTSEGGYIEENGIVNAGGCIFMGDTASNKAVRGFISYDITGLNGATIQAATLTFHLKQKWSDPSALGALSLCSTFWGANPLVQAYFISSCRIGIQNGLNFGEGNITCSSAGLTEALQDSIHMGWPRFQITFWLPVQTNWNGAWDGWEYDQGNVNLNITYTY